MAFTKSDLEQIKNKISLISEIEKKTKLIKKGKDYWCCCLFHKEKTPSMKINDESDSFYCFGCGAKGDIFSIYTDLYNYSFQDAVNELALRSGITLKKTDYQNFDQNKKIKDILNLSAEWFMENLKLKEASFCKEYLKKRNLSDKIIKKFKLGFSYNSKITLFDYLKSKKFDEKDIIKSNVVKINKSNKIIDYFYKRIIFPIMDERSNVVGFGGRSIDNSNPKYINSPESDYFKKRYLLYNLSNAKITARKKNNILICEGYMDVISLYEKGIESVVAPLGTALTEQQLFLSWKHCSKPTVMFDGDSSGLRAAYKTALMSLGYINAKRFLQFIILPKNEDPDSFVNNNSFEQFIGLLKNPISLVNFIFEQSSEAHSFDSADDKIIYDKYIDEITNMIKDNKIKYFYKNEFKSLFFNKIKTKNKKTVIKLSNLNSSENSLLQKQLFSFVASYINHIPIRKEIFEELKKSKLLDESLNKILEIVHKTELIDKSPSDLLANINDKELTILLKKCLKSEIYQLFPYSSPKFASKSAIQEIKESCNNIKTRLSNLEKINKSLGSFVKNENQLKWDELQKINKEIIQLDQISK
tara:strand:- start:62 stop:1819 length:1758 start_codon:yes stop_codon:yes gene_type:complete